MSLCCGTAAAEHIRAEQLRLKLLPLWQDYRFQATALLALTAAIVIAFR